MPPVAQFKLPTSEPQTTDSGSTSIVPKGMPPVAQFKLPDSAKPQQTPPQSNAFYSPLQNFASGNNEDTQQHGLGALKQASSDILSAGAQNAGPVGKEMLSNAPEFAADVQGGQQALKPSNVAQQEGAQETSAAEGLIPVGAGVKAIDESAALATKRIASTADSMTTKELEQEASRIQPSGKVLPSNTEKNAGGLLAGKTSRNPVETLKAINNEIASRGKEAETYLEKNAKPITNKEDFDAFQSIKNSSEKYMTPAESKAYDEQIGVFQKILKGYGKYNTSNYYKALKEYESQVTANLPKGKDALLVPGGSARIQAAKDVRSVVRDMIGSKHGEFKGKMFDLASLYDVKGNVAGQVADKAKKSSTFMKRHPIITGVGSALAGGLLTGLGIQETGAIKGMLSPSGQ